MTNKAKIGDTVTALYGDTTVKGVIDGIAGGWTMLKLTEAADFGFRVAPVGEGLGIRPCDAASIKVVVAGPELDSDALLSLPRDAGGGTWLR